MAITSAQLLAAITPSQTLFSLTNIIVAAGQVTALPPVGQIAASVGVPLLIDNEIMFIVQQPVANLVQVRGRGSEGTPAQAHDILANVYIAGAPNDFQNPTWGSVSQVDPTNDYVISIGQDATVTIPLSNGSFNINKASACAIILPAPALISNAVTIVFTSNTAFAHTITATGLINDGTASSPHNLVTFAAQKGAAVTFAAENGLWNVLAQQNVTVS